MFEKNSAFSAKPEVTARLERIRQGVLDNSDPERDHSPQHKLQKDAAYHLLTAAELMLEMEDTDAAARLIREAKEELDAEPS